MTDAEMTDLLASYRPSDQATQTVRAAKIVLLVGITGAGKNTLKNELLKDDEFYDFISHTTRAPRSNEGVMEQHGVDYFFIDEAEALRMLKDGEYIEAKRVHSNIYGTAIKGLEPSVESGKVAVNDVDVQGVDEYKAISSDVHAIFILPPSFEEWNRRRLARYGGQIDEEDNQTRMTSAMTEIEYALNKGYYDFVVNDDVAQAVEAVKEIVAGKKNESGRAEAEVLARTLHQQLSTH